MMNCDNCGSMPIGEDAPCWFCGLEKCKNCNSGEFIDKLSARIKELEGAFREIVGLVVLKNWGEPDTPVDIDWILVATQIIADKALKKGGE